MSHRNRIRHALALLVMAALVPTPAAAICDAIPAASDQYRSALGATNRPYSSPSEFVQIQLDLAECHDTSTGFIDLDPNGQRSDDYVVTIVFTPPDGDTNAVVMAEDCAALAGDLATCDGTLGAGTVSCLDTDAQGPSELLIPNDATLGFRFPDTDDRLDGAADDRTLSGPARIAVTPVGTALPCGLATARCGDTPGLTACIDEFYDDDGTCNTNPTQRTSTFQDFTALPPPNSFQAMCATPNTPCTGADPEVRATTDVAGNLLVPFDWSGVWALQQNVPVPRLVSGDTSVAAFASAPNTPVDVPGQDFLASFSLGGVRVPPIFTPAANPMDPDLALFGSVDAARGVSRIARRSPAFLACVGGGDDGRPCTEDAQCGGGGVCGGATCSGGGNDGDPCASDGACPGGECGGALFDFTDRYEDGVGPVSWPAVTTARRRNRSSP